MIRSTWLNHAKMTIGVWLKINYVAKFNAQFMHRKTGAGIRIAYLGFDSLVSGFPCRLCQISELHWTTYSSEYHVKAYTLACLAFYPTLDYPAMLMIPNVKSCGPCLVAGHLPTLPWVRSRVWVRVGL